MDRESIKKVLQAVPLFKELNFEEINKVIDISQHRQFDKGAHVFLQGDSLENVYFIHSGKIKIYKNDINGREQIVSIIKKGDMFPHVGFFRKGNYPAFSYVIEDALLVVISIEHFEKLLLAHPEVSIKLFRVLGEKIIGLQDSLEAQILNNTYEQIIKLLLRLSETDGKTIHGKRALTSNFTNKDLANMIGTTRETVSRTITKLKRKGILESDSSGHLCFDHEELEDELSL